MVAVAAPSPTPTIGVLALQGGVSEHVALLSELGARTRLIRSVKDLTGSDGLRVDALVLPGGESSVIDRLARRFELEQPLREAILAGLPTLGTCAGLIYLAARIENPAPEQQSLGVLDVTVDRNAFGPQKNSAEADLETPWGTVHAAFIRAPRVTAVGPDVQVAATLGEQVIAVTQKRITGIAFHPEITGDPTIHARLIRQAAAQE